MILSLAAAPGSSAADSSRARSTDGADRPRIVDSHLHYINFLQETAGAEALIKAMDACGVEQTMLAGVPVVKKWDAIHPRRPLYYLEDDARVYWYGMTDAILARALAGIPEAQRRRIHPFLCGFNPTDRNAVDHVRRMLEWYPEFWEGIGEILTRHDDLSALTEGEQARADHVALDPIYDLAAAQDLPVSLHSNIGSTWLREPIYLPEVENVLRRHPRTRLIWAHAGMGRRTQIDGLTAIIRRMLKTHDNLWIDLAGSFFETCVVPSGRPSREWVDLIEEFPDRFMIGTDRIGDFQDEYRKRIANNRILLAALKPDTARRVARDNFLGILPHRVREKAGHSSGK
jgi:predicted TIM-barrel fold metal-dependent hydrolase